MTCMFMFHFSHLLCIFQYPIKRRAHFSVSNQKTGIESRYVVLPIKRYFVNLGEITLRMTDITVIVGSNYCSFSKKMDAFIEATSAGVGGCFSTVCLYPLDTIKTRQQSSRSSTARKNTHEKDGEESDFLSLYRGVQYKALLSSSAKFLYFYNSTFLTSVYCSVARKSTKPIAVGLLIGYLSEGLHLPFTLPLEVISTRIQLNSTSDSSSSSSVLQIIENLYRENNNTIAGFYKSWKAYFVLCLQPAIQFTIFEKLKHIRSRARSGGPTLSMAEAFIMGALARCIATLLIYPFIRLKMRMIADGQSASAGTPAMTFRKQFQQLVKQEGLVGLYRGIKPELLRGALSSALMLTMKEHLAACNRRLLVHLVSKRA